MDKTTFEREVEKYLKDVDDKHRFYLKELCMYNAMGETGEVTCVGAYLFETDRKGKKRFLKKEDYEKK